MSFGAHLWTVTPTVVHRLSGAAAPAAKPWQTILQDPVVGPVRLSGRLSGSRGGGSLLVVVHGLGGSHGSFYAVRAARAAEGAGLDCLRLNLRGADRSGEDYYHAGLTADLAGALASPLLEAYDAVVLLGYSLGGHLVLRYAAGLPDPRVRAVAAVCAPLDLESCCAAIDRPALWAYRRYLLHGLVSIYAEVAKRRSVPTPLSRVKRIRSLRAWDDAVVAPRHGFESAHDYYTKSSVGPHLARLRVPSLLVACEEDPMVPAETLRPWIAASAPALEVRWTREGGHVGFPARLSLGQDAPLGLEPQILRWLVRKGQAES